MGIFKNKISIESKPFLNEYILGTDHRTANMSFSSLFMWRNVSDISWDMEGEYLCVSALDVSENGREYALLYPPYSKTGEYRPDSLRRTVESAMEIFAARGLDFRIRLVPEHMLPIYEETFGSRLRVFEDRDNAEYVYDVRELAELRGRAFHAKKNHLNYFKNNFEYEYVPLTRAMKDEIVSFEHDFVRNKVEAPDWKAVLMLEASTLGDLFDNMEAGGYFGGAIKIDGKVEAFCIAAPLNGDTVTEHVEKANVAFRGLYQAINNEFCKSLPPEIKFLNREEDMGLENLRKSKLSLNPKSIEMKYTLHID